MDVHKPSRIQPEGEHRVTTYFPAGITATDIINRHPVMMDHQKEALEFLTQAMCDGHGAYNASPPGFGKTGTHLAFIACLTILESRHRSGKHLVIAPQALLQTWIREVQIRCPAGTKTCVYHGMDRKIPEDSWLVVTTIGILQREYKDSKKSPLFQIEWSTICLDEGNVINNGIHISPQNSSGSCSSGSNRSRSSFSGDCSHIINHSPNEPTIPCKSGSHVLIATENSHINRRYRHKRNLSDLQILSMVHHQTARAVLALGFVHKDAFKYVLSGTPINNRASDIVAAALFIDHKRFTYEWWQHIIHHEMNAFDDWSSTYMITFHESVLQKVIPSCAVVRSVCGMTQFQKSVYLHFFQTLQAWFKAIGSERKDVSFFSNVLECIGRLRQVSCDPRLISHMLTTAPAVTCVDDIPSGKTVSILQKIDSIQKQRKKVIVASNYVTYLKLLSEDLERFYHIGSKLFSGDQSEREKAQIVDDFMSSEASSCHVLFITTTAGGVGLNLQRAREIIECDACYNPALQHQLKCRMVRLGQKEETTFTSFRTEDSIEIWMDHLSASKVDLSSIMLGKTCDFVATNFKHNQSTFFQQLREFVMDVK